MSSFASPIGIQGMQMLLMCLMLPLGSLTIGINSYLLKNDVHGISTSALVSFALGTLAGLAMLVAIALGILAFWVGDPAFRRTFRLALVGILILAGTAGGLVTWVFVDVPKNVDTYWSSLSAGSRADFLKNNGCVDYIFCRPAAIKHVTELLSVSVAVTWVCFAVSVLTFIFDFVTGMVKAGQSPGSFVGFVPLEKKAADTGRWTGRRRSRTRTQTQNSWNHPGGRAREGSTPWVPSPAGAVLPLYDSLGVALERSLSTAASSSFGSAKTGDVAPARTTSLALNPTLLPLQEWQELQERMGNPVSGSTSAVGTSVEKSTLPRGIGRTPGGSSPETPLIPLAGPMGGFQGTNPIYSGELGSQGPTSIHSVWMGNFSPAGPNSIHSAGMGGVSLLPNSIHSAGQGTWGPNLIRSAGQGSEGPNSIHSAGLGGSPTGPNSIHFGGTVRDSRGDSPLFTEPLIRLTVVGAKSGTLWGDLASNSPPTLL